MKLIVLLACILSGCTAPKSVGFPKTHDSNEFSCKPLIEQYKWDLVNSAEALKTADSSILMYVYSFPKYSCVDTNNGMLTTSLYMKFLDANKCWEGIIEIDVVLEQTGETIIITNRNAKIQKLIQCKGNDAKL